MSTSASKLSYLWHRKDPREHEHARPEIRLQDLRARVADLDLGAQSEVVVVPATEAVRHHLDASEPAPVVRRTRDRPRPAARTDGSCVASGVFALSRKAAPARCRLRAPCFYLLTAHCSSARLPCLICPLRGWGLMMAPVRGTQSRLWSWWVS